MKYRSTWTMMIGAIFTVIGGRVDYPWSFAPTAIGIALAFYALSLAHGEKEEL